MKKVTLIALMLALTAALLTACRSPMSDEVPGESTTRPTTAPTTTAPTTTAPTTTAPTTTAPTTAPTTGDSGESKPTQNGSATENTGEGNGSRMPGM